MNLTRLIYTSRVTDPSNLEGLQSIFKTAHQNNPDHALTGVLCYDPRYFLQWIEGPDAAVHELFAKILRDKRHFDVSLIDDKQVTSRVFPEWSMAYLSTQRADQSLINTSCTGPFNPYEFSDSMARSFLIKLAHSKGHPLNPFADIMLNASK